MGDDRINDALMEAARGGDGAAYAALYRRYSGSARREAVRRCRRSADVDDVVVAAFSSVFRVLSNGGATIRQFRPYLMVAVRNAAVDFGRRRRDELARFDELDAVADQNDDVDATIGPEMMAALSSIPERQRVALWCTEVEGHSSGEVAEMLGMSGNAFAALKARARRSLACAYARECSHSALDGFPIAA